MDEDDRLSCNAFVVTSRMTSEEAIEHAKVSHAWSEARKGNYMPGVELGLFNAEDA